MRTIVDQMVLIFIIILGFGLVWWSSSSKWILTIIQDEQRQAKADPSPKCQLDYTLVVNQRLSECVLSARIGGISSDEQMGKNGGCYK